MRVTQTSIVISLFGLLTACNSKLDLKTKVIKRGAQAGNAIYKLSAADCLDPDLSQVSDTVTLMLCDGNIASGKLRVNYCENDGQTGCITTDAFPAVDKLTKLKSQNIVRGTTVAGVAGTATAESHSNCTSNGGQGCIATGSYYAATACSSDGASQCFVPRYVASTQPYKAIDFDNAPSPDPWDLRAGVTVGSVTGKLQTNCRNLANTSLWDQGSPRAVEVVDTATDTLTVTAHGYVNDQLVRFTYANADTPDPLTHVFSYFVINAATDTFQVSTTSGGAAVDLTAAGADVYVHQVNQGSLDVWDTIDDYNNGGDFLAENPWSSENACGGIEAVAGDDGVWKDVTSTVCDSVGDECRYLDKISGLEWSEAAPSDMNWGEALSYCQSLTLDGQADWRLPSQKELMGAYEHGIRDLQSANFISDFNKYFRSASTVSKGTGDAWLVTLAIGQTFFSNKILAAPVVCVRG